MWTQNNPTGKSCLLYPGDLTQDCLPTPKTQKSQSRMSVLSCWLASMIRNTSVWVSGMVNATWLPPSHTFRTPEALWKYTHSYSQKYCDLLGDVIHLPWWVRVTVEHYQIPDRSWKHSAHLKGRKKRGKKPLILKSKNWFFTEHTFLKLIIRELLLFLLSLECTDDHLNAHWTSDMIQSTAPLATLPTQFLYLLHLQLFTQWLYRL